MAASILPAPLQTPMRRALISRFREPCAFVRGFATLTVHSDGAVACAASKSSVPPSLRSDIEVSLTGLAKSVSNGLALTDPPDDLPAQATPHQLHQLQVNLGYALRNPWLLRLALVHCSAAPTAHNAVLAWLGDAALGLALTEQLAALAPAGGVGDLAPRRNDLASRQACTARAEALGLRELLVCGKSVRDHTGLSNNMLAEAFEAVLGAVYVDGGMLAVQRVVARLSPLSEELAAGRERAAAQRAGAGAGARGAGVGGEAGAGRA